MPFKIETVYVEHASEEECIVHIGKCAKANPNIEMSYNWDSKRGWRTFWRTEAIVSGEGFYDVIRR